MNSSVNNSYNNNNSPNAFPRGRYGPFGTNDNNTARQRTPSNLFPQNGGLPGSPLNRFNPLTTNSMQNMHQVPSMTNFQKAFQPNVPIVESINYANQNNLLHNNLGASVLDEHIVEYQLNIDSIDRDISVYPNPFDFAVTFKPIGNSYVRSEVLVDPNDPRKGTKIVNEEIAGSPMPYINRDFRNVKYVKLDSVVLPQCTKIKNEDDGSTDFIFDRDSSLLDDRFVVLGIDELVTDKGTQVYDTGDSGFRTDENGDSVRYVKPFAQLLPDKILGRNFYSATPYHGGKTYKNSLLGNLTKMSLKFVDSCSVPLEFNNLFTAREIEQAKKAGDPIPKSDMRHPLNKNLQVSLRFIVGVVESQINNNTKFEQ